MDRIRHMATRTADPSDFVHKDASGVLPVDRLAADFARWASNKHRITNTTTITGDRLLRVLRILGGPTYHLAELNTKAEQTAKAAAWSSGQQWEADRRAARAAQKAVDDAYSAILRDIDTLFTALTGIPADTAEALDLDLPLQQLASDARLLLAVSA
jgi:hypothetical protein